MYWELWDVNSKNLVADFATEGEALQAIREILAVSDPDDIDVLALAAMYDEGESRDAELPPALRGEALRSRLAESAQPSVTDDAVCAVHERIRKWLVEEGWHVQDFADLNSSFNVMATLRTGQKINIYQLNDHVDHITIHEHIALDEASQSELLSLPDSVRREASWSIYRDVALMGVDFEFPSASLHEMRFYAYAYFDALTKDLLVQKILLVLRAASLSVHTIARSFAEAGRPPEAASNLLHLVPSTSGPLTVAS